MENKKNWLDLTEKELKELSSEMSCLYSGKEPFPS